MLTAPMKDLIATFPLGFVASVTSDGAPAVPPKGSDWFKAQHPIWLDVFGGLAKRIQSFVEINIHSASEIWTPPYDDGATEAEMIATYKAKFGAIYP